MKYRSFKILSITLALGGVFLGDFIATTVMASLNNERPLAIIRRYKPDVSIKHAKAEAWQDAQMAAPLFDSDTLRTDANGYAAVQFMDNSLVKVKPNSLLIIRGEVLDKNSTASRIAVEVGEVFLNVTKRQSQFEVQTPTAVATVKGTSYNTEVSDDGSTTVTVLSGSVELIATKSGQKVTLTRKNKGTVDAKSSNLQVSEISNDDLNKVENNYQDLDSGTKPKTIRLRFGNNAGQTRQIEIQYFENE
jgi:ferric-dicitrate binding protein FerR (iron transport regulator)